MIRSRPVICQEKKSSSPKAGRDDAECLIRDANLQTGTLLEQSKSPMPRMRRTKTASEGLNVMGEGLWLRDSYLPTLRTPSLAPICEGTQHEVSRYLRYLKQ
jgi:hypothetical protein